MASIVDRHATEAGKQGGKRWQVRWRDDHNKDRRKAFAKKAEAERFASQIEHELKTGNYRDPRAGQIPFDEYARVWLQSQVQLRASTYELYEGTIRNHLAPFLGSMRLNRITAATGRELLATEMPERTKGVTVQLLKRITRQAADDMLLPHNPLESLKTPKEPRREANFLTISELNHLVSHVHPHFQTLVLIAGFLGLRQGELFGLRPANVDLGSPNVAMAGLGRQCALVPIVALNRRSPMTLWGRLEMHCGRPSTRRERRCLAPLGMFTNGQGVAGPTGRIRSADATK